MKWILRFGRFWYDFIVGDDWTVAVAVVLAVSATAIAAHLGWNAWPLLPLAVVGTLAVSAWVAVRRRDRSHHPGETRDR